jgi:hypothetical protein
MSKFGWAKLGTLILLLGVMATVVSLNKSTILDAEIATEANSGADSIRLVGSETAFAPFKMNVPGLGNGGPTFTPQFGPIGSGLNVSVNRSVTVAADKAYVVIFPPQVYGNSGYPIPISDEDRVAVIAKLAEVGIAQETIEFGFQPYGPSTVSVAVEVGQLPQIGEQILDAVENVLGRSENHGARFGLAPGTCEQALAQVRRQAVAQGNKIAADLAHALGIQQGGVTGAAEYPFNYYGPITPDSCGSQFQDPSFVEPFDAEPKLDVALSLQFLYAAEPAVEPPAQP